MLRQALAHLVVSIVLVTATAAQAVAGQVNVLVVMSGDSPSYQQFLEVYRKTLPKEIDLQVVSRPDGLSGILASARPDLVVTVGSQAAAQVRQLPNDRPVLYTMLLKRQFETQDSPTGRSESAIFIDPPWKLQADLIRLALPDIRSVGLIYSGESSQDAQSAAREFKSHGIAVAMKRVEKDELYPPMQSVLSVSDVLLAIPDSTIYNSNTIRNILLTCFRSGKPLIGLSASYVRAGALYAVYVSPEDIATDTARETESFSRTGRLSAPGFARSYSISVNQDVARTLGLDVRSASELKARLMNLNTGAR